MTQSKDLVDLPVEVRAMIFDELLVPRSRTNACYGLVTVGVESTIHSKLCHYCFCDEGNDSNELLANGKTVLVECGIYPQILRTCHQYALEGAQILYGKNQFEMEGSVARFHGLIENNIPKRFLDMIGTKNASMITAIVMPSDVSASFGMSPRCQVSRLILPKVPNDTLQLLFVDCPCLRSVRSIILTMPLVRDEDSYFYYRRHLLTTLGISEEENDDYMSDESYTMVDDLALKWVVLRAMVVLQQHCPSLRYIHEISIDNYKDANVYRYVLFTEKPALDVKSDEDTKFEKAITMVRANSSMLE